MASGVFLVLGYWQYVYAEERIVPSIPPTGERLRLIIDSDAACESDDIYAIALALAAAHRCGWYH